MKLLHWNANSVIGRITKIESLIKEINPDVISFNETRTNDTTDSYIFDLAHLGYMPMVRNRPEEDVHKIVKEGNKLPGGGVALLIRDTLVQSSTRIEIPERFSHLETLGINIKQGNEEISLFTWYIPPDRPIVDLEFLNFIEAHGKFILMGDLNAKLSKFGNTNSMGVALENILQSYKGSVINKEHNPTFVQFKDGMLKYSSTLDLLIASDDLVEKVVDIEVLSRSAVYESKLDVFHMPIIWSLETTIKRHKKERKSFHASYLYNKANWEHFVSETNALLIDESTEMNIEIMAARIEDAFKKAADLHIPKSKENKTRISNFPPEIKCVLNSRNYWGRQFKKYRSKEAATNYQNKQGEANELIRIYRIRQWEEFLKTQGPHPLSSIPFWKRINRLRASKRRKNIESVKIDGTLSNNDDLETKFTLEDNSKYDNTHKDMVNDFFNNDSIEKNFSRYQKTVKEFNMQELTNAIRYMNSKTSLDPMGLSNRMIKHSGEIAKERILELFNKCLREHRVPVRWKHSVVSMLHKSGLDSSLVTSYRPISLTPCLARLFERLILGRLNKILKEKNLIIKNQSGFRQNRQTRDNLLHLTQKTQEGFNKDQKTLAIFFDIAGAFDKVWHEGLLYKLYCLGIPYYLLMIIKDFLKDRTFTVKVNGIFSSHRKIGCGVSQGGVLSPTLFSFYINDVPLATGEDETTLLFADDIVYRLSFTFREKNKLLKGALKEAQKIAQKYLDKLEGWMNTWRLSLAPRKCAYIIFSKARDVSNDNLDLVL